MPGEGDHKNLDADFGKEASDENKKEHSDNIKDVMPKDREEGEVSFRIHSNYLFNSEEIILTRSF